MLMKLYQMERFLWKLHVPILPKMIKAIIFVFFNCVIPPECNIEEGTKLWHHGLGIIIHPSVRIGKNCQIYNHVVIGGGHDEANGPPINIDIGDNVLIATGAKILCRKTSLAVGSNSIIMPNSVVLEDIPSNVFAGGIPARVVKSRDLDF